MNSRPLLLGHRGARAASRLLPGKPFPRENTLPAFEYALAHGCDGFEFDVRCTLDSHNVLCHDPKLRGRAVAQSSFDELCRACAEQLPCLEEVLEQFGSRAYLDIELKECGYEESVVMAVNSRRPTQDFLVSSFKPAVLRKLHEIDASIPLGYICDRRELLALWRDLPIQVVLPKYQLVTRDLLEQVHTAGLQLFTWTVNRKPDLLRLASWGADGLIGDDPALLNRVVAAPRRHEHS